MVDVVFVVVLLPTSLGEMIFAAMRDASVASVICLSKIR